MLVYRWRDITQGRVATPEKINTAVREGLSVMRRLHAKGWIESAVLYGSAARGDAGLGSDVDALVISKPAYKRHVDAVLRKIYLDSRVIGVDPEIVHITTEEAHSGDHSMQANFFRHINLSRIPSKSVGINPEELVAVHEGADAEEVKRELESFLAGARKNANRFRSVKSSGEDEYYDTLGKAFSRSTAIARKLLGVTGALPEAGGRVQDHKQSVQTAFGKQYAGHPAALALERIASRRSDYLAALGHAVDAVDSGVPGRLRVAKREYEQAVAAVEGVLTDYEAFLVAARGLLPQKR